MGLLSRPEEVAALVRLKVAAGWIRRQIPPETHWAFAYEMLQQVSRCFTLGPELRNAFVLCSLVSSDAISEPRMAVAPKIVKYVGTLKDSTTVSIAKVNSDYKQLDIAIIKATNHVERPAKEKYIRDGSWMERVLFVHFCTVSFYPKIQTVGYISATMQVALKMLIVIHRALREVDPSFRDELISYGRSSGQMLHMYYFKDDSSPDGTS
ncbi:hypothetical protein ZWY2020_054203 [Hordeum vulgare]|nr:hypothetical protein ZWY2020_054203 [Hordeum vulgare]